MNGFRLYNKNIGYYENPAIYLNYKGELVAENENGGIYKIDQSVYIIERYTGVKDKNGKSIYAGDIVKFTIDEEDSCCSTYEEICEICFGGGDYPYAFTCKNKEYYREHQLFWYLIELSRHDMEIIGNVHENPELLENK